MKRMTVKEFIDAFDGGKFDTNIVVDELLENITEDDILVIDDDNQVSCETAYGKVYGEIFPEESTT